MTGRVVAFDEGRGLGEIESDGERYPFHCTAIADGTRSIAVDAEVEFTVAPGAGGRWQAADVERR
ncbi:MAG: cold shock domain-containing protein [Actinobacteria bacterium]|nr:cold shock domain-containing protein [Actinomycetota bacterium]